MTTNFDIFRALADPTRRALFERLREGPKSVGELGSGLPVSQPAVSQHLRVLRGAQLVEVRQQGKRRIYRFNPAGLDAIRRFVDSFSVQVPPDSRAS